METSTIIALVAVFLITITLLRRSMLKEKVERRKSVRRQDKRRTHTGRRKHEFHAGCEMDNRRKQEDRRSGKKDRRFHDRRHTTV